MDDDKLPLEYVGGSLKELRKFPKEARYDAVFELEHLQHGEQPTSFRPLPSLGSGVLEIKIRSDTRAFRIIYAVKYLGTVFVLHCFEKKDRQITRKHTEIIKQRYKQMMTRVDAERIEQKKKNE